MADAEAARRGITSENRVFVARRFSLTPLIKEHSSAF
jgi:hypothetical protein